MRDWLFFHILKNPKSTIANWFISPNFHTFQVFLHALELFEFFNISPMQCKEALWNRYVAEQKNLAFVFVEGYRVFYIAEWLLMVPKQQNNVIIFDKHSKPFSFSSCLYALYVHVRWFWFFTPLHTDHDV